MIDNFDNGIAEQSQNERVGENNTPANDGVSAARTILNPKEQSTTMKEGTIEYRDAFRWGKGWGDRMVNYRLSDDGVLTVVRKNSLIVANPAPDAVETEHYDEVGKYSYSTWDRYESPFVDLEFHTAILEDGFDCIEEGFFSGCKGLKKIILTDSIKQIRPHFADNTPVEYLNEGGLLYLGTADNPHYFLVGCADDYDCENLVIAEGTHYVSDGAFDGKTCIRGNISFPASLVRLGELAFRGTSIKHLYIPDRYNRAIFWVYAFQSRYYIDDYNIRTDEPLLESISVPYGYYEDYLENKDETYGDWWHRFVNCAITFRNPDGTTAAVLPPDPAPLSYDEICGRIEDELYMLEYGQVPDDADLLADKLIYRNGKPVVPAESDDNAWLFFDGLAAVTQYGKWGFVDRAGKTVIEPQFDEVKDFRDGTARVRVNRLYGFIDRTGRFVVEPAFDAVSRFENGIAWVRRPNEEIVGCKEGLNVEIVYDGVRFTNDIRVRPGDKLGLVDRTGKMIVELQFSAPEIEEDLF